MDEQPQCMVYAEWWCVAPFHSPCCWPLLAYSLVRSDTGQHVAKWQQMVEQIRCTNAQETTVAEAAAAVVAVGVATLVVGNNRLHCQHWICDNQADNRPLMHRLNIENNPNSKPYWHRIFFARIQMNIIFLNVEQEMITEAVCRLITECGHIYKQTFTPTQTRTNHKMELW